MNHHPTRQHLLHHTALHTLLSQMIVLLTLLGLHASVMADQPLRAPKVVPEGWIATYDYTSGLRAYLAEQASLAKKEGKFAYVYFYRDDDRYCKETRQLTAQKPIHDVFAAARIVLLDFRFFRNAHLDDPENRFDPGQLAPLIARISPEGDLTEPSIHPDVYLFHPHRIPENVYRRKAISWWGQRRRIERLYAQRMEQFFSGTEIEH